MYVLISRVMVGRPPYRHAFYVRIWWCVKSGRSLSECVLLTRTLVPQPHGNWQILPLCVLMLAEYTESITPAASTLTLLSETVLVQEPPSEID